jgi:hypothetical protein
MSDPLADLVARASSSLGDPGALTDAEQIRVRQAATVYTEALKTLHEQDLSAGQTLEIVERTLVDQAEQATPKAGEHISYRMTVWIAADGLRYLRRIADAAPHGDEQILAVARRVTARRFAPMGFR